MTLHSQFSKAMTFVSKSKKIAILLFLFFQQNLYSQSLYLSVKSDATNLKKNIPVDIKASGFVAGQNMTAAEDSIQYRFQIRSSNHIPYNQSAVKQQSAISQQGPNSAVPYFHVRFALPIPPVYSEQEMAPLVGVDASVYSHNHSPGFAICPNGDALAIYFSTPAGKSEDDTSTTFVQARLRYGSEDWDMPELFFKTVGYNDQSGLLWNDKGRMWFFGGGRNLSNKVPFKIAHSDDNGATWEFTVPELDVSASNYTAQPISNAFRAKDSSIYFTMDGAGSESFLWRSKDNGKTWHDMGGRTGGRHSTILPLDENGTLLSIGGKNASVDGGWSPQNRSTDWGATWSPSVKSPFPPLGTAQRPSMIRLASGKLLLVSDAYMHKKKIAPPAGWNYGNDCFVALSDDNGLTWRIKTLPVQLPAHHRVDHPSLGYVTVNQAPNGVIHMLTTVTLPALQYEFNEAWLTSDEGDIIPESTGGVVRKYSEKYANGRVKSEWSARICPNGRYLLHGKQVDYYENGAVQHRVDYYNGRKTGRETYWSADGVKEWTWSRDLKSNTGVWTIFWRNGNKKVESNWDLKPVARDLKRNFYGYVAHGEAKHWDENAKLTATYIFEHGSLKDSNQKEDVNGDWMKNR